MKRQTVVFWLWPAVMELSDFSQSVKFKRQIDLLWETFHHQRCVLSVATCSLEDGKGNRCKLLFSAATDGKIAVWDLTEVSFLSPGTTPPIPCLDIPAHQSGVNALAVWANKLGQQGGGCLVTVASGGDDGQLTVSMIMVQYPEDGKVQPPNGLHLHLHSQSHIPLAHAAPLTALKFLSPGLVVSTSSDQRVCMWRVGSTSISHIKALCSHVADAAGLAVWEGESTEEEEKRKTRLESEQGIAIWRGKGSPTGLKPTPGETGGRVSKDKETADEVKGEETVEADCKTGGPVCTSSDKTGGETASEHRNQTEIDGTTESDGEQRDRFKGFL
ncbi:WD repeat-containing protein 6 [Larimichthys crocea]|uniref:Uncharacterized protein n=1 Tax=Larimichthys crocea TaxID=215358 RepID=A0ACD3R9Y9_LARCR|nr:WD repeat-containing protein 6 [Larimichthys crocea]